MKKITKNKKIIAVAILVILSIFCFYKFLDRIHIPKNLDDNIASINKNDLTNNEADYWGELKIVSVSPDVGFETGLIKYPRLTWKTYTFTEKRGENYQIDVDYPHFKDDVVVKNLNKYISDLVYEKINQDREDFNSFKKTDWAEYYYVSLFFSFRVIGIQNGIVSIEIMQEDFTGGGNGNHDYPILINWDLRNNKLLTLKDKLFCSNDSSLKFESLLREKIVAKYEDQDAIDEIDRGMKQYPSSWENVVLYKNGLLSVHSPYELLSGSAGVVSEFIPDVNNLLCFQ